MKIIITTLFGLESTVKDELKNLGFDLSDVNVTDGRIEIECKQEEISENVAKLNIWLRTAERVFVMTGSGEAQTFDELFELANKVHWEDYIPFGWAFHVNGHSLKSTLFGISACQSIVKKAIVKRLLIKNNMSENSTFPEDKEKGLIRISFSIVKNKVTFMIDTTGDGLHKRGYRPLTHEAPLKETLAAGLVLLSMWRPDRGEALLDPMCGSGTIPIEAALIDQNIAPGINRKFSAESWPYISPKSFEIVREEAMDKRIIFPKDSKPLIFGSDIDSAGIEIAKKNALRAGVYSSISFSVKNALDLKQNDIAQITGSEKNLLILNPPYGERMLSTEETTKIFRKLGNMWLTGGKVIQNTRISILAPKEGFENDFGAIADKRRKLYNGTIQCNMYHYFKNRRN